MASTETTSQGNAPSKRADLHVRRVTRRLTLCIIGAASALLLVGCGTSTITISNTDTGVPITIVVTGDSSAIPRLEHNLPVISGASVQNGDDHVGSHFCGFSVSKDGHTYQVDFYVERSGPVPNSLAGACGSANQKEFLSRAP